MSDPQVHQPDAAANPTSSFTHITPDTKSGVHKIRQEIGHRVYNHVFDPACPVCNLPLHALRDVHSLSAIGIPAKQIHRQVVEPLDEEQYNLPSYRQVLSHLKSHWDGSNGFDTVRISVMGFIDAAEEAHGLRMTGEEVLRLMMAKGSKEFFDGFMEMKASDLIKVAQSVIELDAAREDAEDESAIFIEVFTIILDEISKMLSERDMSTLMWRLSNRSDVRRVLEKIDEKDGVEDETLAIGPPPDDELEIVEVQPVRESALIL